MKTTQAQTAEVLLNLGCVQINLNNPFTYSSGLQGPIYCDNRLLISHVRERKIVLESFLNTIEENTPDFDYVAAIATAGIPYGAWIAEKLNKPLIYIRSKSKEHGKKNLIEGHLPKDKKIIVIEDLVNQGKSSSNAIEALSPYQADVLALYCIVDYQMDTAKKLFASLKVPVYSLTNFDCLSETYFEQNKLSSQKQQALVDWQKNPLSWQVS